MKTTHIMMTGLAALAASAGAGADGRPMLRPALGLFTQDSDIGTVRQGGSTRFDARTGTYRVVGNGDDLWAAKDDFHFVSRPATGDIAIAATVTPVAGSDEPHSKAGLMIRQDLTPGSPYADMVVHQNGLVALQFRQTPGGITHEVKVAQSGPGRFRLVRRGDYVSVAVADADGTFRPASGNVLLTLHAPFHVGLLVCSHSDTRTRTDAFTRVAITKR